jgi:hypothetical protein
MAKPPPAESPTEQTEEPSLEDSFYEVPQELGDVPAPPQGRAPPRPPESPEEEELHLSRRFPVAKVAVAVGLLLCLVIGFGVYRKQGQRKAVREGIARAETLMLLDTAEAYRKAADLLAPLVQLDPLEAGSARAFALAMLASDYRDPEAEIECRRLLVAPSQAKAMPRYAALAFGTLALGRNALGDATSALDRAAEQEKNADDRVSPWAEALEARVALRAGTLDAALEPATAAVARAGFAAGLAVHGDASRRAHHDARSARASYEAALAASPTHPRAAYGLAKLALAGQAPEAEARDALTRIVKSGEVTPAPERGRAALHLAALRIRDGEPVEAVRRDLGAGMSEKALDWLMGAARAEAANRGAYRAVAGAPASLESASDDDPPDLRPLAPEPPPPPPPPAVEPPASPKAASHAKAVKPAPKASHAAAKPAKAAKPTAAKGSKPSKSSAKAAKPAGSKTGSTKAQTKTNKKKTAGAK